MDVLAVRALVMRLSFGVSLGLHAAFAVATASAATVEEVSDNNRTELGLGDRVTLVHEERDTPFAQLRQGTAPNDGARRDPFTVQIFEAGTVPSEQSVQVQSWPVQSMADHESVSMQSVAETKRDPPRIGWMVVMFLCAAAAAALCRAPPRSF